MMTEAWANSLPPPGLVDITSASLLLDFDGTLVDLQDDPYAVVADDALVSLLGRLADRCDGRVALVSGRSLDSLVLLLGPVSDRFVLSGSHGCELRLNGATVQPDRPPALDIAADRMAAFAHNHPGTLFETKSFGVGLHFRRAPDHGPAAIAFAQGIAAETGLAYQAGSMMAEVRLAGGGKGAAVASLMQQPPMRGTTPIFLGDDDTDEAALAVTAALGGVAIAVGPRPSASAGFALPDPISVRYWLETLIA